MVITKDYMGTDWIGTCLEYYKDKENYDMSDFILHIDCICTVDKANLDCPYISKCFAVDVIKEKIKGLENKAENLKEVWGLK